jgi:hypothetical protein
MSPTYRFDIRLTMKKERCERCNKDYDASMQKCPYCKTWGRRIWR